MIRALQLVWAGGEDTANSIQDSNKINVVATTRTLNNIEEYCKEINA